MAHCRLKSWCNHLYVLTEVLSICKKSCFLSPIPNLSNIWDYSQAANVAVWMKTTKCELINISMDQQ